MRNYAQGSPHFASNALKGLVFEKYFDGFGKQAEKFAKSMRDPNTMKILKAEQP